MEGQTNPKHRMLGMSTSMLSELSQDSFRHCRDAGVECIEYVFSNQGEDAASAAGREQFQAAARWIRQSGLVLWSVHLPFFGQWSIDSPDPDLRRDAVRRCCGLIGLAAGESAAKAVVHGSGEDAALKTVDGRAVLLANSIRSLCEINEKAKAAGVQLALEVLPRICLGNTSAEVLAMADVVESLGICCDMNHPLQETAVEFIERCASRIVTTHISDYDFIDEKHWLPGCGVNDWQSIVGALARAGYSGPFVYEARSAQGKPFGPEDVAANFNSILRCGVIE